MAGDIVKIWLTVDTAKGIVALRKLGDESAATSDKMIRKNAEAGASFERVHTGSKRAMVGVGLMAGALGAGVGGLAYGIINATKAGMGLQAQQALLASSLKNTGIYSTQTMDKLTSFADTMASRGGFGAQENIQSLTQLTRVTGNAATATRDFALATDIARGAHKDLLPVTKALAMVEQGRTTGLARMGIVLPKGATPQQAMRLLQQRFGGAAAAYSNTAAGGSQNLKQSFDVLKEEFGKAFLPLVSMLTRTLTSLMPQISKAFNQIAQPLSATLSRLLPPLLNVLAQILPPILSVINAAIPPIARVLTMIMPPLTASIQLLLPVFQGALNALVPVIGAVVPVIARAVTTLLPPLVRLFSQVMPILTHAFQVIAPPLMRALSTVVTALAPVIGKLITSLAPLFPVLATVIATVLPPLVTAIASFLPALGRIITAVIPPLATAFIALAPPLTRALLALLPAITLFSQGVGAFASHISPQGVVRFGKPGHTNALQDVANFIFNPFGVFNSSKKLPHRASGGLVPHMAGGGFVGGYPTGKDTQLIMATPGEYVLSKPAVQRVGAQNLNSINTGGSPAGRADASSVPIVIPVTLRLGQRVLAEEVVHYALRFGALS